MKRNRMLKLKGNGVTLTYIKYNLNYEGKMKHKKELVKILNNHVLRQNIYVNRKMSKIKNLMADS